MGVFSRKILRHSINPKTEKKTYHQTVQQRLEANILPICIHLQMHVIFKIITTCNLRKRTKKIPCRDLDKIAVFRITIEALSEVQNETA